MLLPQGVSTVVFSNAEKTLANSAVREFAVAVRQIFKTYFGGWNLY